MFPVLCRRQGVKTLSCRLPLNKHDPNGHEKVDRMQIRLPVKVVAAAFGRYGQTRYTS